MEESISKEKGISVKVSAGFSSAREDLISRLPDSLISQMLLYLPTKEAVKTSVLSKRWKSLWLLVPELELASSEFPDYSDFVGFMDTFLDFSKQDNSCLHKLKLSIQKDKNDESCVTRWIDFAATPKLKHLDVECLVSLEVVPSSLFICETLIYLRLHRVLFGSFESVCLPHLKTMRLENNIYANEAVLESFISSCPVLEDLTVSRTDDDNVQVLRVHSHTLTSLSICCYYHVEDDEWLDDFRSRVSGVLIDAPRLVYLNLENDMSHSKIIRNPGSLAKVNVAGHFYLKANSAMPSFFTSISGVRDIKISWHTLEFIHYKMKLPQFCNLSCLEAEILYDHMEKLSRLLESCPNLKSLVLSLLCVIVSEEITLSSVPQCLLSSIDFVEIKIRFDVVHVGMEVARYFIENSGMLKKLVLRLRNSMPEANSVVLRELLALPTRSSTCQILVC